MNTHHTPRRIASQSWSNAVLERALGPQLRATLDGLEVQESSFIDWLEAGGERRQRARADESAQALGFKPTQRVLVGADAVAAYLTAH